MSCELAAPGRPAGDRDVLLLVAGLATATAALIAMGAAESLGLALGAVTLLAVGPVAYAGLTPTLAFLFATTQPKSCCVGDACDAKKESCAPPKEGAGTEAKGEDSDRAQGLRQRKAQAAAPQEEAQAGAADADGAAATSKGRWKPFPWNWLPDSVALVWGGLEILFIAPLMAVNIGASVPAQEVLVYVWRHPRCSWLRTRLPELVRSVSKPLGRVMLRDPRNHSYIPWMAFLGLVIPGMFFYVMYRHAQHGLELSTLFVYHVLRIGPRFRFFAHLHTLVHKEGHDHKGFFRGPFQVLNHITEWWIGPFFGVVPNNYRIAHMKIHHRWHNDVDDVHTNLDLDRTKLSSFLIYTPRFTLYWTGLSPLALLVKRREWYLTWRLAYGMIAYYGVTALLWSWNPVFCLAYWLFPHVEAIVLLCAISYLWHAFVEESDPANQYVNSVTILEGHDNVWNEDFHVVHHHSPNTHWTDAPAHFEANREHYAAVTATIFRDTEEGMLLKWLFENNWDMMAKHFVDLNNKLSHEEKKALILRRLRVIVGETGRDGRRLQREWAATETIRDFD